MIICVVVAFLVIAVGKVFGDTYFNDGGTYNINYSTSHVRVDQGAPSMMTTVNLLDGGSVYKFLGAHEDSRVNIYGGAIFGAEMCIYDRAELTMSGGQVFELDFYGSSHITMSGGTATGSLFANDNSQLTLSGGSIGSLFANNNSQVTMTGGSVGGLLSASNSSYIEFSGGLVNSDLVLESFAVIKIYGSDFAIDGNPVGYGEITSILGGAYGSEPIRHLAGTLLSSELINNDFRIGNSAKIILAPQPTPPIADAGSDQTVMDTDDNGSEQVTLDGSGSSDSDGTIVSWVWTDNLGDTIPDGEVILASLSVGTHIITLTVTDNDGLTDTDTVTVTVEPGPSFPPDANANGSYTIFVGDTLTLDASGSTDDENDIVSYLWDLDDNNSFETDAGDHAVFDVNYAYLQLLGLLVDNTYNIHLKVTDGEGQSNVANSTLTILPIPALLVLVDIKPVGCPNPLNVKDSGVLPVAILGTNDYDITTIDPTSIRLAGVEPLRNSLEDVSGPVADSNDCNCTANGPDGFLDLTLKFKIQKIVETIGDVNEGDVLTLELTGVLFGERPIEGADCVVIRGRHKPFNSADINKDGVVDMLDFTVFSENWLQSSIIED